MQRTAWAHRADAQRLLVLEGASLPIWSCSVWGLPCPRRYRRSGALLPHHFTLTPALEFPQRRAYPASRPTRVLRFQGGPPERGVAEAVSFLWHWPSASFEAHIPDVIRHTALRSSDFPPPEWLKVAPDPSGSDRPVLLPGSSVSRIESLFVRFGAGPRGLFRGVDL